jgi:protein SCO1
MPNELKPRSMSSRERTRERYFPNVILRTHHNKKVRFYDDLLKDKIVTINFMYSKCEGVCPGITANLLKVQKLLGARMGRDIFMYSITLKPEQDTPKVLKQYAKMHAAGPGWVPDGRVRGY